MTGFIFEIESDEILPRKCNQISYLCRFKARPEAEEWLRGKQNSLFEKCYKFNDLIRSALPGVIPSFLLGRYRNWTSTLLILS